MATSPKHPDPPSCEKRNIETVRDRIRAEDIISVLEDHVIHGTEMASSQVTAALALLKKTVPDLPTRADTQDGLSHEEALDLLA